MMKEKCRTNVTFGNKHKQLTIQNQVKTTLNFANNQANKNETNGEVVRSHYYRRLNSVELKSKPEGNVSQGSQRCWGDLDGKW